MLATDPTIWLLTISAATAVNLLAVWAATWSCLTDGAACAGSVLVQKTLFCTDLARTLAVLVNALLAEGTECARHHCALFLART